MPTSYQLNRASAELWRTIRWAFSHNKPGGSHDEQNLEHFMEDLERYIELKVRYELERQAP